MFSVTPAHEADLLQITDLLEEMDRFYGVTEFESASDRQDQIHSLICRNPPAAFLLLARHGDRVVGLASYSILWPAVGLSRRPGSADQRKAAASARK